MWYEIEMLDFCYGRLKEGEYKWRTTCDFYVYLEAFLLHFRNLVACFSGNHHQKTSDVDFSDLKIWTDRKLAQSEIERITGPAKKLDCEHYYDLSQFLAHVTTRRSAEDMKWKVKEMYSEMKPISEEFLCLFPPRKQFCGGDIADLSSLDGASTETKTRIGD